MGPAGRVVGIDVGRGVAILGMFVAHAIPRVDAAEILADGRSSILFATLAGVSLGIITGAERPFARGSRSDRISHILLRAAILFVLGVLLSLLESGIAIILDYYAIMFVLLLPLLFLRRSILVAVGVALAVAAPLLAALVGDERPGMPEPLFFLQYYLLTGYYPALIWLPFLIAGLVAARSGLTRASTQYWMIGGGVAAAAIAYGVAATIPGITAEAHSGSTAEVIGSGGVAVAVIGALLWMTQQKRLGVVLSRILWPIGATGAMALTVYTLQIVTLAVYADLNDDGAGGGEHTGWPLLSAMALGSILFASLWRRYLGTGPLERLMSELTRTDRAAGSGSVRRIGGIGNTDAQPEVAPEYDDNRNHRSGQHRQPDRAGGDRDRA